MDDVELVARAILKARQDKGASGLAEWDSEPRWVHELYGYTAKAAIAALTAAGWRKVGPDQVVVLREPSEHMIECGRDASVHYSVSRIYRAMISAAPPATHEGGDK